MTNKMKTPNNLKVIIDNEFSPHHVVDLLFISHFDCDHINGIEYLIQKRYVTNSTKVILPLLSRAEIALVYPSYRQSYIEMIKVLANTCKHISFVKAMDNDTINDDDLPDYLLANEEIDTTHWKVVESGSHFDAAANDNHDKIIWSYLPFYLQDKSVLDDFRDYCLGTGGKSMYHFTKTQLDNYQLLGDDEKKSLRKAYQAYKKGSTYKKGPSRINMNSMLLVSKPESRQTLTTIKKPATSYNGHTKTTIQSASAIYTADVGLAARFFLNKLREVVNKHLPDGIGLFQIPHHGSVKNYYAGIYTLPLIDILFINGNPKSTNPAICADAIHDAYINTKPLYIIDDNPNTLLEEHIQII